MGCVGSDGEDELKASPSIRKRFKFPKKFCNDCIIVDYVSVPRKLRSAIKKRSHVSISPGLRIPKKLNYTDDGVALPRKDGLKKFKKHGISGGLVSEFVVGSITKDEEEVAETLYALAGLFPDTTAKDKTKLEGEPSETKSTAFQGVDNSRPALKAIQKEEAGIMTISRLNAQAPNHSSNVGGSAEGVRIQSLSDASQPEKCLGRKLSMELHNQNPKSNLPLTVLNFDAEHGIQRLSCNTVVFYDLSSTNKVPGSNIYHPELSLAGGEKSDQAFRSAAIIGGQHELLYTVSENKSDGSMLWPGLSLTESRDSNTQGLLLQSSATKLPAIFPNTSCSLQPPSLENSVATKKDAQVQVDSKKSWKRCCTHVHIAHLIKVLQKTERADTLQMQSTRSTTNEGSNRGALLTPNNLTERSTALNRIASTNSAVCSTAERNAAEVRNAMLLHKRLLQDQQQASTTSGLYDLQKQNLDFFSLPAGGARGETSHGTAKADHGLGTTAQLHSPCLQSRNHSDLPFLLRQNCYTSIPSISHPGAAAARQVQLPPYLGSSNYGPSLRGVTASSKQQAWQQQQQNWNYQLITHHKPGQVAAPNIQTWQNAVQDAPSLLHYAQSLFPPSHSSIEVLGSNYTPRQQQPLVPISPPLPPSRVQNQHHHMPYGYQRNGGGRHPERVPPFQLLCNEHF